MMNVNAKGNAQTIIPVVTLKSGVFTYKNKPNKKENTLKHSIADTKTGLYPKLDTVVGENTPPECSLIYEENSTDFFIKIPAPRNENGDIKYTMLECSNISAADLKVSSKYGWETMNCRLLVECRKPLVAWTTKLNDVTKRTDYIRMQQESCMVKATFEITAISQLKHLLQSLKVAQLKSRKQVLDRIRNGEKTLPIPTKMQEGLPEWVNYIPRKWYSSNVRKVIEYTLMMYTILTLCWAIWQLYKHVDFIRRYIRPLIDFIEFYVEKLKDWIKWVDTFADLLTKYWWKYMKPIYVLFVTLYASLAQLFKPLRNIAGLVGGIFGPVVNLFRLIGSLLNPVISPIISSFRVFASVFHKMMDSIFKLWAAIMNSGTVQLVVRKFQQTGITNTIHNVIHGGLDPFRAQFVVIRDLVLKSVKQIYYGVRFIWTRMYLTFLFWRRERQYATEVYEDDVDNKVKKS